MEPVTTTLGVDKDWVEGAVAVESIVGARVGDVRIGEVHHIPKFAMERYMYFAGLVKDNVGVTLCQWIMGKYMSAVIKDLKKDLCPRVFVDIVFLIRIFIEL
jgi:hypothetical protein